MRLHPTGNFDNRAADYRHIEAHPLAAAMGAEIRGVQAAELSAAQFDEIRDAFAEDAYTSGVPGHRNVHPLIKEADDQSKMVFGEGWHTDSPFLPEPPAITMLYSIEIPPLGGDTIWANSALAYSLLSDTYRRMIDGLRVHFSMRDVLKAAQDAVELRDSPIGRLAATRGEERLSDDLQRKIRGNAHPLVRTHPVTGEKALYVDGAYAINIEGMLPEEAAPLLQFLAGHITQHAFTCRLRWEPRTLAIWDNRLCVHQAFNDYQGHRRELCRTTVAGEKPS